MNNKENKEIVPATYTVPEAASIIGISVRFMWEQVKNKKITHVKLGGRVLIRPKDIDEFLERHTVK